MVMAFVNPTDRCDFRSRIDWGAMRARMVSRFDRPTNWMRRGRPTRASHQSHHDKTYRMAK